MVNVPITIKTTGNHAYVGYNSGQSGGCTHGEGTDTALEDRGLSNHNVNHTYNFTQNLNAGDWQRYSVWEYIFANTKSIKLYAYGKLIESDSGNKQCAVITHQWTLAEITPPVGGRHDTPTYLEELAKLDQHSTAQYVPDRYNLRY